MTTDTLTIDPALETGRTGTATTELASETRIETLTQEDLARLVGAFRGQPRHGTPTLRYVRGSPDGLVPPYVWDEESGMVYILD